MPDTQEPIVFHEGEPEEHSRKIALIVREILVGKTNNGLNITLEPNQTMTLIERRRVCCDTKVSLTPQSASAAAALATGTLWVETTHGRITIHHDAQPDTDRVFGSVLVG